MGIALELPWREDPGLSLRLWLLCVQNVTPQIDQWAVSFVLGRELLPLLPESLQAELTTSYPTLARTHGDWKGSVSPNVVGQFLDALTADRPHLRPGWYLTKHLLQLDLMQDKRLLFSSQEFGEVVEVHPGADSELELLIAIRQSGLATDRIHPGQKPVQRD